MRAEADVLQGIFDVVDECIGRLEAVNQPFSRVCALTLTKARNLALGCYSLSLDALGQEAGALLRPLLEALELLTYFRLDPPRIEEALEGTLPKAGVVAQRIEGKFKRLREYLNANASHFSFGPDAMLHLVDFRDGQLKVAQPFNELVLHGNLQFLFAIFAWVRIEAVNCVSVAANHVDHELADRADALRQRGLQVFEVSTTIT